MANTENFYFESFDADYYLKRNEEGVSEMEVVENFTTIFPTYNQNKGICREIPFTNHGGDNITLPNLSRKNITVLRNGVEEPIYSIDRYKEYYEVCTGNDDYVLGRQVYTFKYSYEKVATDFTSYQEVYWDTNGNGWLQKFDSVTARLHFVDLITKDSYEGESWCYVGKYGESGQERCQITNIADGVAFSAKNLNSYENLTFDAQFKAGTFTIPEPEVSYILLYLFLMTILACGLILIFPIRKLLKTREKIKYYNDLFVKPEYQPSKEYSLAEMAEVYIGKKRDVKVGILLDLIVRKKICLVKENKWSIRVLDLTDLRAEELAVLAILNGGSEVKVDDVIGIKTYMANTTLVKLARKFDTAVLGRLKVNGLVENNYRIGNNSSSGNAFSIFIILLLMVAPFFEVGWEVLVEIVDEVSFGRIIYGQDVFPFLSGIVVILTIIACIWINKKTNKFAKHKAKGLAASRYMDGLKLYIGMAEADRLKLLQSVEGADVSSEGIVKLYEKLLPYAAIFGLEDSWMKELEQYCKVSEIEEPDWIVNGLAASEISRIMRNAATVARQSSTMVSSGSSISGGGSSSSSFSGGGGGGFSGGGGGGGGGHGR